MKKYLLFALLMPVFALAHSDNHWHACAPVKADAQLLESPKKRAKVLANVPFDAYVRPAPDAGAPKNGFQKVTYKGQTGYMRVNHLCGH